MVCGRRIYTDCRIGSYTNRFVPQNGRRNEESIPWRLMTRSCRKHERIFLSSPRERLRLKAEVSSAPRVITDEQSADIVSSDAVVIIVTELLRQPPRAKY